MENLHLIIIITTIIAFLLAAIYAIASENSEKINQNEMEFIKNLSDEKYAEKFLENENVIGELQKKLAGIEVKTDQSAYFVATEEYKKGGSQAQFS